MILLTLLLSVSDPSSLAALITILLLAVGSFVGPLAPLAIEVAAECTYPAPEASFTAVQQVFDILIWFGVAVTSSAGTAQVECRSMDHVDLIVHM